MDLNTEKSIIINLPDVTDKLFNQYYLLGEYIQVTPNGIKWRGEYLQKATIISVCLLFNMVFVNDNFVKVHLWFECKNKLCSTTMGKHSLFTFHFFIRA